MCPRDPDNQSGCGYTMDSGGKSQRYATTYGHGCWDCETVYSGTHGHEVVIPPPPPRPPKPVVMLNAKSAADLLAWSARMNSLVSVNAYETGSQADFEAT